MVDKTGITILDDSIYSSKGEKNDSVHNMKLGSVFNVSNTRIRNYKKNETGWVSGLNLVQGSNGVIVRPGTVKFQDYTLSVLRFMSVQQVVLTQVNAVDFIHVNSSGQIQQLSTTSSDYRNVIIIGAIQWATSTQAAGIFNYVNADAELYERSLMEGPSLFSRDDLRIVGNTNQTVQSTSGYLYYHGLSVKTDPTNPNRSILIGAQNPLAFFYTYRLAAGGFIVRQTSTTTFSPGIYDDNTGTSTTLPTGVVQEQFWCTHRLYLEASLRVYFLQIGRTAYQTSSAAIEAAERELDSFQINPVLSATRMHAYIVLRGGATNFSLSGDCVIIRSPTFQIRQ